MHYAYQSQSPFNKAKESKALTQYEEASSGTDLREFCGGAVFELISGSQYRIYKTGIF